MSVSEGLSFQLNDCTCDILLMDSSLLFFVVRTFPTHKMFIGETAAKMSLYRVLMMYSQYNTTVGYCQGE